MSVLKRMAMFIFGGQAAILFVLMVFYSYGRFYHGSAILYNDQQSAERLLERQEVEGEAASHITSCSKRGSHLPESISLCSDRSNYFIPVGQLVCFVEGTDIEATAAKRRTQSCVCNEGYFGHDCGIPETAWKSCLSEPCFSNPLKRRSTPRRIIHGLNVNHEIDFFEVRLKEIGDVVDVFIVGESNYTAGGDLKPIRLLPKLKEGFLEEFQHKIIHVIQDHFPSQGLIDGWFADTYLRDYMGREGLKRVKGFNDDDLFLLLDADEIPAREVLLFLKLYDGYPEPIALGFQWNVYGFFWKKRKDGEIGNVEAMTRVVAIASMKMIRQVYGGNVMSLRRNHVDEPELSRKMAEYGSMGNSVQLWTLGTEGFYAGHHCSWCFNPEGIRTKLVDAQKDDKPRWGDYPDKLDLKYIANLIRNGEWFDNSQPFFLVEQDKDKRKYAPDYILKNKHKFQHILFRNSTS